MVLMSRILYGSQAAVAYSSRGQTKVRQALALA